MLNTISIYTEKLFYENISNNYFTYLAKRCVIKQ